MTNRNSKLFKQLHNSKKSDGINDRLVLAVDSLLSMVGTNQETRQIHKDIYDLSHVKGTFKSHYSHKYISQIIYQLEGNISKLNNYIDRMS